MRKYCQKSGKYVYGMIGYTLSMAISKLCDFSDPSSKQRVTSLFIKVKRFCGRHKMQIIVDVKVFVGKVTYFYNVFA